MVLFALGFTAACGASEDGATAASQADLSQFPTPTRAQNAPTPTPATSQVSQPPTGSQTESDDSATSGETVELAELTQEDLQQLRERLQSGDLSEEETAELIQQLQAQFGGGGRPGGGGFGGFGEGGGTQAVGAIESIDGNTIVVRTELSTVTATVEDEATIRITSVLEQSELTEGTQVTVLSERIDGRTLARTITIVPEGQGGFGQGVTRGQGDADAGQTAPGSGFGGVLVAPGGAGQTTPDGGGGQAARGGRGGGQNGGGGGGFAGRRGGGGQAAGGFAGAGGLTPLFGTVDTVNGSVLTIETQQGPLPVTIDEDTVIIQTTQGTLGDLEPGMQVSVNGAADDNGVIEARVISVTPEGLEGGGGFGGFGGGRGGFGGGGGRQGGGQGGGGL